MSGIHGTERSPIFASLEWGMLINSPDFEPHLIIDTFYHLNILNGPKEVGFQMVQI